MAKKRRSAYSNDVKPWNDDFLDQLIGSSFGESGHRGGYVRRCPVCGEELSLDDDGVWSCPKGHYRHP